MADDTTDMSEIEELLSTQKIRDVLMRYCRGIDRCDLELLRTCYHPGAVDEHGSFNGDALEFCEYVIPRQRQHERGTHTISNVLVEFHGRAAHVESYFVAYLIDKTDDGSFWDTTVGGRYIDRFEERGGQWKIAHRRVVMDWNRHHPSQAKWDEGLFGSLKLRGSQDKTDPVYTKL